MKTEQNWYALRVRSKSEPLALASLRFHGLEAYWPHSKRRRQYADRVKMVETSIIPGYLFCRFDLSHKSVVLNSHGVDGIVSFGSLPAPIPPDEIESVRRTVEAGGSAASQPPAGSRVRVLGGCLAGLEGTLVREARQTQFLVSVELLQRSVSISIDQSLVEVIPDPSSQS